MKNLFLLFIMSSIILSPKLVNAQDNMTKKEEAKLEKDRYKAQKDLIRAQKRLKGAQKRLKEIQKKKAKELFLRKKSLQKPQSFPEANQRMKTKYNDIWKNMADLEIKKREKKTIGIEQLERKLQHARDKVHWEQGTMEMGLQKKQKSLMGLSELLRKSKLEKWKQRLAGQQSVMAEQLLLQYKENTSKGLLDNDAKQLQIKKELLPKSNRSPAWIDDRGVIHQ